MRIGFFMLFGMLLLASCATSKPLYSWEKYETASYQFLKNGDEQSINDLMETYQKIINNQKGSRGVVPPGVYADYGYLLLQKGKTEEGVKLLKMEVALYPESEVFVARILKMLEE